MGSSVPRDVAKDQQLLAAKARWRVPAVLGMAAAVNIISLPGQRQRHLRYSEETGIESL
jgi:hypothetical protein